MSEKVDRKFYSCVTSCPPKNIRREQTKVQDRYNNEPFIPFGIDNLLPQCLSALQRKGSIHRSVISKKTLYMTGNSFVETSDARLNEWLLDVNGKGDSLNKFSHPCFWDKNYGGNIYIAVQTDSRGTFVNFNHIDATKGRISKDGEKALFHPDWVNYRLNDGYIKEIPLYPNFDSVDGVLTSIIHIKEYEPEFRFYGLPSYIGGLDAIAVGYKTDRWNVSKLDNSMQPSGILEVVAEGISEEGANKLRDNAKAVYSGADNVGKLLTIIKEKGAEQASTFTPFTQNNNGEYVPLHDLSTADTITAHGWYKSLSGVSESTGFDTKRILNDYNIALVESIQPNQQSILSEIKRVLKDLTNFSTDAIEEIDFINKAPLNELIEAIDVNAIVTKGEGREALGLDNDNITEEKANEFIKTSNSNTKGNGEQS